MGDFKPLNSVVIVQPNSFYNEISRRASNGATELALLWGEAAPKEADAFFFCKDFRQHGSHGKVKSPCCHRIH